MAQARPATAPGAHDAGLAAPVKTEHKGGFGVPVTSGYGVPVTSGYNGDLAVPVTSGHTGAFDVPVTSGYDGDLAIASVSSGPRSKYAVAQPTEQDRVHDVVQHPSSSFLKLNGYIGYQFGVDTIMK